MVTLGPLRVNRDRDRDRCQVTVTGVVVTKERITRSVVSPDQKKCWYWTGAEAPL